MTTDKLDALEISSESERGVDIWDFKTGTRFYSLPDEPGTVYSSIKTSAKRPAQTGITKVPPAPSNPMVTGRCYN